MEQALGVSSYVALRRRCHRVALCGCFDVSLKVRLEGPSAANVAGGAVEGAPERQEVAEGDLRVKDASKRSHMI